MKKLLVIIGAIFLCSTNSYAATNLVLCYSNSGAITARKKCARGETVLSGFNIGGLGLTGQAGTAGANGKDGTIDPSKCTKREAYASGNKIVTATTACMTDEFILNSGCSSLGVNSYQIDEKLDGGGNSKYPQMYSVLSCTMGDGSDFPHMVTAHAICCRP